MDDRLLASVRDGAMDLDELMTHMRDLVADDDGREAIYDGLRDRMATLLRSEFPPPEELATLREALRRISALAWGMGPSDAVDPLQTLAIRMEAFADQAADAAAFSEAYKIDALRRQPHFENCLLLLARSSGRMARADLLEALGLKEANGTRVLKVLEKSRLIVRQKAAQSVTVALTPLGQRKAEEWSPPSRGGSSSHLVLSEPLDGMSKSTFNIAPHSTRQ